METIIVKRTWTAPQGPQSGPRYLQNPPRPPPPGVGGETKQPQMTACHFIRAPAPCLKSLRKKTYY